MSLQDSSPFSFGSATSASAPPQPATPSYKPLFQSGIQVLGPWGPQEINPEYCLTQPSAVELAVILGAKVVLDTPFGHWPGGGGFSQMSLVPWLEFPSPDPDTPPVRINAGQLAWVFVRYPYDFALTNVRGQVALAQRGNVSRKHFQPSVFYGTIRL